MSRAFWEARRRTVCSLAESISIYYFAAPPIHPQMIADDEGITYNYGHYQDFFDGLLQHQYGRFHIFLNLDRIYEPDKPRARFTFAHELGHYFIDEHRDSLKMGKTPPHSSFNAVLSKNPVEREADSFASSLLMPAQFVRNSCVKQPLSEHLITELSDEFQVSISAMLFRYLELDLFPMAIICSKNGRVDWCRFSEDFKYKRFPSKGSYVPAATVAGEYFNKNKKYINCEVVYPEDWFLDDDLDLREEFCEKCYYQSSNIVYSVLWKKEN